MREFTAMDRRSVLSALLAGTCGAAFSPLVAEAAAPPRTTGLGLVIYDCNLRRQWMRMQDAHFDLFEPLTFLKHSHSLGAGGMQASLGVLDAAQIGVLRDFTAEHDLFIDAIVRPPEDRADVPRFEAEIKTARDVGVQAARTTIIPGRRYERFQTLDEFLAYQRRGQTMLELAAPVVERNRVMLAVENHKDQRIDERIALLKHLDCEYIGACVDTGNSFALLDGVYDAIESLAPYAMTVHLKDQALQAYEGGFLLGDIPLGQGSFDLKRMVAIIKAARPNIRFALELITRDPLKVPCLTEQYWSTLPNVPGSDLARAMRFVRDHATPLQYVSGHALADQVELEDMNLAASLLYAGEQLGL